jgi:GNAT superfamily N-acetyltransferase
VKASIRQATEADARAIAEVHVKGWQWAYRGHLPDEFLDQLSVDRREATWRTLLTSATRRVWLAENVGRVVGFVATAPPREPAHPPGTAEVGAFYLLEEAAGRGVGVALHHAAIEDLCFRGFHRAYLWVLRSNGRARRFYERCGWNPDGATKVEPLAGFELDEMRYVLELPPRAGARLR